MNEPQASFTSNLRLINRSSLRGLSSPSGGGTKMKIKFAVAILAMAFSSAAMAQSKPIKVQVRGESDAESQQIVDRLSGQIGSSSRYALVTDLSETILLKITCLPNAMRNGQQNWRYLRLRYGVLACFNCASFCDAARRPSSSEQRVRGGPAFI
jgi:hypothetical protein